MHTCIGVCVSVVCLCVHVFVCVYLTVCICDRILENQPSGHIRHIKYFCSATKFEILLNGGLKTL